EFELGFSASCCILLASASCFFFFSFRSSNSATSFLYSFCFFFSSSFKTFCFDCALANLSVPTFLTTTCALGAEAISLELLSLDENNAPIPQIIKNATTTEHKADKAVLYFWVLKTYFLNK